MSVHPAPAINTQRGGSGAGDGSIGALPIPYIPSWLRAHRWWQLLMGAGCPRGMSGSGEGCDGGREVAPQRRFPELDPDVPLRRDGDAAFGVTINKGWKRPMKRGFSVAKVAKCPFFVPFFVPSINWGGPCPSLRSPMWDNCVPGYPLWDKFQHYEGPRGPASMSLLRRTDVTPGLILPS